MTAPPEPHWKTRFAALKTAIEALPEALPTLEGCALVEITTGMVLHSVGELMHSGALAEASSDYWRHYQRHGGFFEALGPLRYCVLIHQHLRITVFPCTQDMVLVLLTKDGVATDWQAALARAAQIGALASEL